MVRRELHSSPVAAACYVHVRVWDITRSGVGNVQRLHGSGVETRFKSVCPCSHSPDRFKLKGPQK